VVEIIANDQGHWITPSWVSFTDDERLYDTTHSIPAKTLILFSVGDSAKNAFYSNPENTVFDAKRLIGRKMDDQDIACDVKHWPFKVTEKNGKPVKHKGGDRDFVSYCLPRYTDIWLHLFSLSLSQTLRKLVLWFSPR
jgi:heat shock protein 5